jgi:hypothetical protein
MTRRKSARPPDLDPRRWVPLEPAFQRVRTAVYSLEIAQQDLHGKLVRGPLQAAYRAIVYSAEHPHGFEISDWIKPAQWRNYRLWGSSDGTVRLRRTGRVDSENLAARGVHIFIRRAEFDRFYPPPATLAPSVDTDRHKPGPKPTDEWPEEVAAELIHIALTDPKVLKNIDKLVEKIQKDFPNTDRFVPQDPKPVRALIVRLLKRIR